MSNPSGPSLWEVMAVDPSIPVDQATMRLVIPTSAAAPSSARGYGFCRGPRSR